MLHAAHKVKTKLFRVIQQLVENLEAKKDLEAKAKDKEELLVQIPPVFSTSLPEKNDEYAVIHHLQRACGIQTCFLSTRNMPYLAISSAEVPSLQVLSSSYLIALLMIGIIASSFVRWKHQVNKKV